MPETLFQLRARFANDLFASKGLEAFIEEASHGFAKCSMDIQPHHCNALGIPMGGVMFTLADFAFAVAANQNGREVVTQSSQITFLAPAKGNRLIATARLRKGGKKTCFYQVSVSDEKGTEIAFVTVSGFVIADGGS